MSDLISKEHQWLPLFLSPLLLSLISCTQSHTRSQPYLFQDLDLVHTQSCAATHARKDEKSLFVISC